MSYFVCNISACWKSNNSAMWVTLNMIKSCVVVMHAVM